MDRLDHFGASALALSYEKNISIEEAQEILFQQTLKLYYELLGSNSNPIQE